VSSSQRAEEWLFKAVKLDPRNYAAWTALGHCLWAKGQLAQAKSCFLQSVEQSENAEALRQLSMINRQIQEKNADPVAIMDQSIKYAKRGIELEPNNHKSWYYLGNANLTRFFSVSHDTVDLKKSLACYDRSEKLGGSINPDLYYNRGNVLRYLQQYEAAISAYAMSLTLDPHMDQAQAAIQDIHEFLSKTTDLVVSGGKLKRKKANALSAQLREESNSLTSSVAFSSLSSLGCRAVPAEETETPSPAAEAASSAAARTYSGVSVALKVIMPVTKGSVPPESFLCVDAFGTFAVLSVYNLAVDGTSQFSTDDTVVVVDPIVQDVLTRAPTSTEGAGSADKYCFSIIQVLQLEKISVGGRFVNRQTIAAPSLSVDVFES
jgi:hypothetical protein